MCDTVGRLAGRSLGSRLGRAPSRFGSADHEERRRTAQPWRAWYSTARWKRLRADVLKASGYQCAQTGVLLIGKAGAPDSPVVDHIEPHRGDPSLFWDRGNLQAVSKEWHDTEKQKQERAALSR